MTMTDPIADMLSRVRNANNAQHDSVSMPSSKLKVNIAEILKQEGYINDYQVEDEKVGKKRKLRQAKKVKSKKPRQAEKEKLTLTNDLAW